MQLVGREVAASEVAQLAKPTVSALSDAKGCPTSGDAEAPGLWAARAETLSAATAVCEIAGVCYLCRHHPQLRRRDEPISATRAAALL